MDVAIATGADQADSDADLVVVGVDSATGLPAELAEAPGAIDFRPRKRFLTMLRPDGRRVLAVGLGESPGIEDLRVAGALVARQAARVEARSISLGLARAAEAAELAAMLEGTILGELRLDRFRSSDPDAPPPPAIERIELRLGAEPDGAARELIARTRAAAQAANRARELQHLPANHLDPVRLAERADQIAAGDERISVETLGRDEIAARSMGGMLAVSAGSAAEPRLIVLRYRGAGGGETLGLVGKAVTFDSGGISLKPAASMHEMKMDMSGGAAVLESLAAIADLDIALDVVAVVPAVENMPSGTATRPGDVITQMNGKTVEVNNTDAEGRLILADALTYCARDLGADRIVDLATLTGGVIAALGSTYAGLISNDDAWAAAVSEAGEETGELVWRLPLHPEYKALTRGTVADLTNSARKRKALTIYAGSFLEEFVEGATWSHLDIAGTAWDTGREYFGAGPSGFGTRLLVALAARQARAAS
ncbi:leucyl aminopeptidase [Thermoleophilia bacterium SCSIO 60948]|nr:leucyl aminopeptidase [Thermoleophilia bacterium SCSIO 60948]